MIAGPAELDGRTVSATFRREQDAHAVQWTLPGDAAGPSGPRGNVDDAVLTAALLPAMAAAEALTIDAPVSARLLASLPTIQDVFATWSRDKELNRGLPKVFEQVPVRATARRSSSPPAGTGVAAFFTGGVDSFYTAMKRREELTGLVFVHGFDVPLADTVLRKQVGDGLRDAANKLGLPLFEVETNVRSFSDRSVKWLDYHGAALASVALLLAPWFRRVYVPATMTYATLDPLGSHPLVDPLWSTEDVELVHDGCEATRLDKLRVIAGCEAAREWLRVCPKNWGGAYNCGHCEKCLRTMVALRLLDPSQAFSSLPALDEQALRRVARAKVPGNGATWKVYLQAANKAGGDRELARALRRALRKRRARDFGVSAVRTLKTSVSRG